jgi:hypothetical protein
VKGISRAAALTAVQVQVVWCGWVRWCGVVGVWGWLECPVSCEGAGRQHSSSTYSSADAVAEADMHTLT